MFEEQQYIVATFGLRHDETLSTFLLVEIVRVLVCTEWFIHTNPETHADLELHLRCIVAGLRLVSAHGVQPGSGNIKFAEFENLYKAIGKWQVSHKNQSEATRYKDQNYNNEFLIVYAQDLITSIPNDRSATANITTRLFAAAAFLGHAVHNAPCQS
jgi:hypothetical protein